MKEHDKITAQNVIPFPALQRSGRPSIELWIEAVAREARSLSQDFPDIATDLRAIATLAEHIRDYG